MWWFKISEKHCSIQKPNKQSKQVKGTNSCVGRHLVILNFYLSSKSHSSRSCPSVAYKNSKTSLFAFPVKANQHGGARHIFAYKQTSWKSDGEVNPDKDSSQVVTGRKESFPVSYDNRVKTVKVLGNSVKQHPQNCMSL